MRLLLYEKHRNDKQEDLIKETLYILLKALKEGDLRFGAKATRGFGKVQLQEEKILWLDMSNPDHVDQWIDFEWKGGWGANCSLDELNQKRLIFDKDWFDIQVKFRIPYSLLIRTYNAEPGEADMVHITTKIDSQEIPIIPGPSWAGALQHAIYHTTLDLRSDNYDSHSIQGALLEIENGLFGEVPETDQSQAHKSRVIIDESLIYHTTLLPYTRIKVDRFSGEVVQGSLFSEEVANQGEVELDLVIKEFQDYEIGLILLAILELWYGLQPIGGTTSIGRGILKGCYIQIEENGFKVDDPLKSNECWTEINQYLKALADHIKNELGGS
jgi:CRISPR/Cas system CSM-associated protein Csm3 (group 7 of RAMP superfamily)